MTNNEANEKYLEYLEGHIGNVKEAFELLCTLDIPFIQENKSALSHIIETHDESKYDDFEWTAYLHHFYPTCDEDSLKTEEFEEACRHHIQNNPHHWDYWVEDGKLIDDIDEHQYKLYTVERLCDHMAMSIQNNNKPADWYFANKEHIIMPDYGYEFYEDILSKIPEDYDLSFHGTRTDGKPERDIVNEDVGLNKDYIKTLGKRAKVGNNNSAVSISFKDAIKDEYVGGDGAYMIELNDGWRDPAGNNYIWAKNKREAHQILKSCTKNNLNESIDSVIGYRSIGEKELYKLLNGETIHGQFDNSAERQNESNEKDVVCFFTKPYAWHDKRHQFTIKCKLNPDKLSYGSGVYYAAKNLDKTKIWTGRRGKVEYNLDEIYAKSYDINNVVSMIALNGDNPFDMYTDDVSQEYLNKLKELGIPIERLDSLKESVLLEAKASQLRNKTKSEDPARVKKSKNVKTTYIGMSKFGILNFKTTSESRSGYHYQTIEFQSLKPFEELIKKNGEIMPMDIKQAFNDQDINIYCSDESFTYWAWYHQAYQNDYAYIDDAIPDLNKRLQAPKVNNVRLAGALCKHLYSVLEYITRPFVLLAISDDMNNFLNQKSHKYAKQTVATQNWYDAIKQWTSEDALEYLGLTREQIIMDLSKTLRVNPTTNLDDFVDELVKDAILKRKDDIDPKLERDIADKVIDELDLETEYENLKAEEVEPNEENIE